MLCGWKLHNKERNQTVHPRNNFSYHLNMFLFIELVSVVYVFTENKSGLKQKVLGNDLFCLVLLPSYFLPVIFYSRFRSDIFICAEFLLGRTYAELTLSCLLAYGRK